MAASIGVHAAVLAAAASVRPAPRPIESPRIVEVRLAPPARALPPPAARSGRGGAARRAPRVARPAARARLLAPRTIPDAPPRPGSPVRADALAAESPRVPFEFAGAELGVVGGSGDAPDAAGGIAGGAGGSPWLAERFEEILRRIQRTMDRAPYPPQARAQGWTGVVVVAFRLRTDGTIGALALRESSGFAPLDRCALEAVRAAAPFPRPPRDEDVVVPIRFELLARG